MANRRSVFVSDCEGPITKNDNAAELAEAFIPKGHIFFSKISLYDDYLAEVVHRPGYKAGDTLRLILPFFKAFGLDNRSMIKFSRGNVLMIPDAGKMIRGIMASMPAYIVSTSYSQYIMAVCDAISFPFLKTFSTTVNLDNYDLGPGERRILKEAHSQILALPDFSIPTGAEAKDDLSTDDQKTIDVFDDIFWNILPGLEIYRIIAEVNPVGGIEKAQAIESIAEEEGVDLEDIFYVGDSITDVAAFRLVKQAGGLALSFNGNHWAVKEASFAVTAQNALPIGWLALLFASYGGKGFEDLMISEVTQENVEPISELSSRVRKTVRTEKIGNLG